MTTTLEAIPSGPPAGAPATDASDALVSVSHLNVSFPIGHGAHRQVSHVVKDVSFELGRGECLAIVGESGSGKSVTARTLVGLAGRTAIIDAAAVRLGGTDVRGWSAHDWRRRRGAQVGFILQDALVSLDPLRTVGQEIGEALRLHGWHDRTARQAKAIELLADVGVPEPGLRARQRSRELSGGLRQRALIASAIANDPPLVIADEPTTALDVTVQAQVLALLEQMKQRGTGIILISHDLAVVAHLADRIAVMEGGTIVEQGPTRDVLTAPQHPYTRALIDAVPSSATRGAMLTEEGRVRAADRPALRADPTAGPSGPPVLEARGLRKSFRGPDGLTRTVVRDISFTLQRGQTLGIVGESGSGKSTTALLALGLLAPDSGTVLLDGKPWSELTTAQRRPRRRQVTVVHQDPLSSFDPRWKAERILTDALSAEHRGTDGGTGEAARLADLVGLAPEHLHKHPLQLSGGQRQRLSIARALAPRPQVIVLDEAVSALDVSVQAQVLDLLTELQARLGTSYLFISHDLGVIHHTSDHVLVMKDGRAVEQGTADDIFTTPAHPYTQQLLASTLSLD